MKSNFTKIVFLIVFIFCISTSFASDDLSTCVSFTYTPSQSCQPNWTQTLSVTSSSPYWCTWWTPLTSQSCLYTREIFCEWSIESCWWRYPILHQLTDFTIKNYSNTIWYVWTKYQEIQFQYNNPSPIWFLWTKYQEAQFQYNNIWPIWILWATTYSWFVSYENPSPIWLYWLINFDGDFPFENDIEKTPQTAIPEADV
ncbi:MAG: hypothetical protein ACD_4C00110G0001, partial [uncultured bacterium (gcode 4)]